eukprot:2421714-Amphidinium_carterae.3
MTVLELLLRGWRKMQIRWKVHSGASVLKAQGFRKEKGREKAETSFRCNVNSAMESTKRRNTRQRHPWCSGNY